MVDYAFDVAKITIPLLVGTVLNWCLLGVLAVQIYIYFTAFPKDNPRSKLLVLFICTAEILQTMSDFQDMVRSFGTGWGNPDVLDRVGWSWFSVPVIGSIIAWAGQLFFAWRIHVISNKTLLIPTVIAIISSFQLGAGIWSGVEIGRAGRFSLLQFTSFKIPTAWLSATAACDILLVLSTCFYLLKARGSANCPGFRPSTTHVVSRIIKVTVETGLLCAALALVDLFIFVFYRRSNYHLAICIWLSKVYSNSILLILNSRARIRHTRFEDHDCEVVTAGSYRDNNTTGHRTRGSELVFGHGTLAGIDSASIAISTSATMQGEGSVYAKSLQGDAEKQVQLEAA